MQFLRLPSKCGGCGLPSGGGREPLRRDFRSRHADPQDCFSPAIRIGRGRLDPNRPDASRHDSPALRPAVARSSARYLNVRGDRLPSPVRPHRCGISDMAYRALRGASPRPLRYDRGVARRPRCSATRPGFPDRRWIAPARPASRTTGVAPANAASLRLRRITSTRPGCPGLPGGPGEAVIGRHQHGSYCTPVISASPAPRV